MIYVFDFKCPKLYNERQRGADGKLMPVDRKGYYPEDMRKKLTVQAVFLCHGTALPTRLVNGNNLPEAFYNFMLQVYLILW